MNRTQAIAKLKKVLGPDMGYRENPKALLAEDREAVRVKRDVVQDVHRGIKEALDKRRQEILAADEEYQHLSREYQRTRKALEALNGNLFARRVTVGKCSDLFFSVKAEGDNWQEVVDKLIPNSRDAQSGKKSAE